MTMNEYQEGMERIDSDIMDHVMRYVKGVDPSKYTEGDVLNALNSDRLDIEDFASLLSDAAVPFIEQMAARAKHETSKHFGNSVCFFTPIYVSNHCVNRCTYCGFNKDNDIHRAKLTLEEVGKEMTEISSSGLTEILILTGESRSASGTEYIGDCVRIANEHFKSIGLEVYPLNTDEYKYLRECGADYITVFQETYDPVLYSDVHAEGPKRVFRYRFDSQERALKGGMRGVAFGALLGLGDPIKDAFACGLHAHMVQRKYPHAEISFSIPRLRPIAGVEMNTERITEKRLLQTALAYRIFMPFAGITISSRESPKFRDNIAGLCATRISAGVSVGIGRKEKKGDDQFEISDQRNVEEIRKALTERGIQPVFNDYVRT
jgi:thiazole biosynthesis protein ThiH